MTPELKSAIAQGYDVFAAYRVGRELDFAARPDLGNAEHERLRRVLATTTLRELPFDAIEAYFDYIDAAYYDGSFPADPFRYFLPRALELMGHGGDTDWLRECIERALERSRAAQEWPAAETQAIARVFTALR